jgi:HSP20 family molecular chaperone IbpA
MNTAVGSETDSFERRLREKEAALSPDRRPRDSERFRDWQAHIQQDESLPIDVAEDESEYKIIVHLSGIDPRKIYVFATPRSLLIELRFKSTIYHDLARALVTESIDRRISREFSLPIEIEQGTTKVAAILFTSRLANRSANRKHPGHSSSISIHWRLWISLELFRSASVRVDAYLLIDLCMAQKPAFRSIL